MSSTNPIGGGGTWYCSTCTNYHIGSCPRFGQAWASTNYPWVYTTTSSTYDDSALRAELDELREEVRRLRRKVKKLKAGD